VLLLTLVFDLFGEVLVLLLTLVALFVLLEVFAERLAVVVLFLVVTDLLEFT
jgi:hypothetical protein